MKLVKNAIIALMLANIASFAQPFSLDTTHSEVGFSVKHLMISNVKGKFNTFKTDIDFDVKTKEFKKLSAVIDANTVNTENTDRDNHLRSPDFFNVEKFPDIKFEMTSFEKKGDNEGVVKGNLTLKGITKPVVLDYEFGGIGKGFQKETRIGFSLSGKINRKDFGLEWNKVLESGGFAVSDAVKIAIEIEAGEIK